MVTFAQHVIKAMRVAIVEHVGRAMLPMYLILFTKLYLEPNINGVEVMTILFEEEVTSDDQERMVFQIRTRDTSNMRGKQDKFSMFLVFRRENETDACYTLGSHPSFEGAKKFGRNKGWMDRLDVYLESQTV